MAVPTRAPEGGTAALPSRKVWRPNPRSCSPDAAAESNGEASDVDPTSGDGADSAAEGNASPLMPPRQSRGEAAAIKLLSSHPMDPPNMDSRFPVDFGRGHKKRYSSRKLLRRGYDVPRGFSCSSQVLMFFAFVAVGAEGWR